MRFSLISVLFALIGLCACNDEDTFSSSPNNLLTFSSDSITLDTVFSGVPSAAKSFWIHNRSGQGIRCAAVRLERGNQTGFRVNVDGVYLGKENGYQTGDIEIRNNDSIRVYVELTSPYNYAATPKLIEDNLVFALESGKVQKVNLNGFSWDAAFLRNYQLASDTVLTGEKPIVVFGKITVGKGHTLTIAAGTTVYFAQDGGIDVYGRLVIEGMPRKEVVLRGNRLDRMFHYLPYDRLSGQWQGIRIYSSSAENIISYADIHSAYNGVVVDSVGTDRQSLSINNSTIHNCQGYGLLARHSKVTLNNSVFSNTLNDCVAIEGGEAVINGCTLAQFYPFDSNRGVALRFGAVKSPLKQFVCSNTLVTGYGNDEVIRNPGDGSQALHFQFESCLLRTVREQTADSLYFKEVIYEDVKDTLRAGYKNFRLVDTDSLRYDFRIKENSLVIGRANKATSLPIDREGKSRDEWPDIGAFEFTKP